jgi:D-3-phosphoglycerate dehydrogenase
VNTIQVGTAIKNGIHVANCPGKNSIAVAELAMGLMLSVDRKIPDNVIELRNGKWKKGAFSKARGLYGRTLGLIGLGNIAQEIVVRAQAFGMKVVVFSRWITPDIAAALGVARASSPLEVAEMSDFVSIHVSLNPATKGMIGAEFFSKLKPGSVLINTSRAEVVDGGALNKALAEGKVYAGLDVFEGEPAGSEADYDGPMKDAKGAYCTHHIGASTEQAQEAVAAETVRIVKEYMASGVVLNEVKGGGGGAASTALVVVRYNAVDGALEEIVSTLAAAGSKVNEMEHVTLHGARISELAVDVKPSDATVWKLRLLANVLDANILPL